VAQVHERERSYWLVIRQTSSKPMGDEVVARILDVERRAGGGR